MHIVAILLVSIIGVSVFSTLFYSIAARRNKGIIRSMYRSYMNISMGAMFISIGVLQLLLPGHSSVLRLILVSIIILVGMINVFYGVKNWRHVIRINNNPPK